MRRIFSVFGIKKVCPAGKSGFTPLKTGARCEPSRPLTGFTLVEILIVVAIIGILASVVLVGLGPVQRRGRDARRIADLKQVQAGLELYFGKFGAYPVGSPMAWATLQSTLQGATIGVSNMPNDPKPGQNYFYGSDGTSYVLGAQLEDTGNPALNSSVTGTLFGVSCTAPVYCVQL